MPELISKYKKQLTFLFLVLVLIISLFVVFKQKNVYTMGAILHSGMADNEDLTKTVYYGDKDSGTAERFQRPSGEPSLNTSYPFERMDNSYGSMPVFKNPEDLIKAYYGVLRDAANMTGYHGGCGTIGSDKGPYPFAYNLLSPQTTNEISYEEFAASFKGTGHTTLLKLLPAYSPPKTPDYIQYYMTEIEVITGPPITAENRKIPQPGYFAYYYGLMTLEHTAAEGWKIRRIDYFPEDFLCAPYHSWFWEGSAVVEIVYGNWYGMIDRIDRTEIRGDMHYIFASGGEKKYRFDFVQLTNGVQVMLHENVLVAGRWQETNILKDDDQIFKLSVLNPRLKAR